jgi:uncharacterized membrane protein YeaQ/YmgE (transglycosylase-associated protein family)
MLGGIIWIIIIGFIAGIIARILSPGPNNPSGFILTTVIGIIGAFLATWIGQAIGHHRRTDRAVHLEPPGRERDDQRLQQVTVKPSLRSNGSARTRGPMTGSAKQSRYGQKAGLLRR